MFLLISAWRAAAAVALAGSLALRAPAPSPAHVVTVTARDFAFTAPATIGAGRTTLRMRNRGRELHHVSLVRFDGAHTLPDLMSAMKGGGPLPAWVHEMGGPQAAAPGGESSATMELAAGHYALLCFIPSADHVPHLMKGMAKPLTVVAPRAGASSATPAAASRTMTLDDYGFALSAPLRAGTTTVHVTNVAKQTHEVLVVRLAPGKTAHDMAAWIDAQTGPPPGMPVGGASGMESGASNDIRLTLAPGEYALLCFIPDAGDGKPHVAHGMLKQVTVR